MELIQAQKSEATRVSSAFEDNSFTPDDYVIMGEKWEKAATKSSVVGQIAKFLELPPDVASDEQKIAVLKGSIATLYNMVEDATAACDLYKATLELLIESAKSNASQAAATLPTDSTANVE